MQKQGELCICELSDNRDGKEEWDREAFAQQCSGCLQAAGSCEAPASSSRMAAALPASSSVLGRAQCQCVYVCCAPGVGAGVLLQTESTYRN